MPAKPNDLPARLYADLLAVPYLRAGRTLAGLDCVGLFLAMQARLGARIPQYASDPSILDIALSDWRRLAAAEPGAGILIRGGAHGAHWHLAVAVGGERMIHAKEGSGIVVERFDSPTYKRRIEGFYRWQAVSALSA